MRILLFLSDLMIPLLFFYIIGFGLLMKKDIYNDFVTGAFDGLKIVVKIMPTLIGLMTGVGILRASGFLDALASLLENLLKPTGFPSALVPLSIVKMFSSGAATSLLLDLYKQHGPDSTIGLTASLILSSTETIFYTLSVYYIAAKVQKTRYTLPGALLATFSGIIASTIIANLMYPPHAKNFPYSRKFPAFLYLFIIPKYITNSSADAKIHATGLARQIPR